MQFKGLETTEQLRYYYNDRGVFVKSSSDTAMSAVDLPYVVKPKGWPSCDYTMVDGELTHTPKPKPQALR